MRHRESFAWSRLLLGSRSELLLGNNVSFMRSQMSVLLSMWHDAITERSARPDAREMYENLEKFLARLNVIRNLEEPAV